MPLTQEQMVRLKALASSGYLPTLERWARRMSAAYWWRDAAHSPISGFRGGTVCFVHTGERILGVTAEHVHREIVELRAADPTLACQVGGHSFEPEDRLIDS